MSMPHTLQRGWVSVLVAVVGMALAAPGAVGQTATGKSTSQPAAPAATPQTAPAKVQPGGTRGVRAPSGGVRAPKGGVRAPKSGVRAPSGGVRAPSGTRAPGTGGLTPAPPRPPSNPPGNPGNPGNPGGGGGEDPPKCPVKCYPHYGWGWPWSWGWYVVPDRYRGPVDGPNQELVDPNPPVPEEPPTPIEAARAWMSAGDAEEAVSWYTIHLQEEPLDLRSAREYAAALMEADRPLDAVAVLGYAYDTMPGLASEAMDTGLWGDSPLRLRRSVTDAVRYAHETQSGNAWLMVAVLMQAEGRDQVALKMLERAEAAGLSKAVGDRLRTRLAQR